MLNSQSQKSGDNSNNIQAQSITFVISYQDAKAIANDVFNDNFLRLKDEAREVASARADQIVNEYLDELRKRNIDPSAVKTPDMQYALYAGQAAFARSGAKDLGDLVVTLLVNRTEASNDLLQLILNDCLTAIPKLTSQQISFLTALFVLRYVTVYSRTLDDVFKMLDKILFPFIPSQTPGEMFLRHLESAGVAISSIGEMNILLKWQQEWAGFLSHGFKIEELENLIPPNSNLLTQCYQNNSLIQFNCLSNDKLNEMLAVSGLPESTIQKLKHLYGSKLFTPEQIKTFFITHHPKFAHFFEVWNSLKNINLTSVGIAIGQNNLFVKTGSKVALDNMLK